jgi:hypothetical protein
MQIKIYFPSLAAAVSILLLWGSGCASSPSGPSSPQTRGSGIYVEQVPITAYMRSQEGTPNELSPIAPSQARNIRKDGNRWLCEINGQTHAFDHASSCWQPHAR